MMGCTACLRRQLREGGIEGDRTENLMKGEFLRGYKMHPVGCDGRKACAAAKGQGLVHERTWR